MYIFLFYTVIVNNLLTWRWPSTAETCRHRRTIKLRYLDSFVVTDLPTLKNFLLNFPATNNNKTVTTWT